MRARVCGGGLLEETNSYHFINLEINSIIAPLSDIPMCYIKYLTTHKVHAHTGAIRQLLYGCAYVREIIHSLKLVDYFPIHTHKLCNNVHLSAYYGLQFAHVSST